jgi:hypothetical protein
MAHTLTFNHSFYPKEVTVKEHKGEVSEWQCTYMDNRTVILDRPPNDTGHFERRIYKVREWLTGHICRATRME